MLSWARKKPVFLSVAAVVALLSSCTAVEDNDSTNTIVYVSNMTTDAGADELFSDVCRAGGSPANPSCTVFNDNGAVTMTGVTKDQIRAGGQFNSVYFTRYRVSYTRADGRNVPGVEVPYPFDGATNFSITVPGSNTPKNFMIVRQAAKLESPLINLQRGGQGIVLSVLARIDFYGSDVAGRPLTVTGYLNITFGDFPDT